MTLIFGIIIFCLLIFPHELGHFIAAKSCGIKVNEFSMGMGPLLLKKQKGETQYSLRAIPIGGFCAMEGEDEASDDERAFDNKPAWQKSIVLIAGSFMNLILAIIIMIGLTFYSGMPTTTIDKILPDSPAMEVGIKSGDRLVSIDGQKIEEWSDLSDIIGETKKDTVEVVVSRDGKEITLESELTESEDDRQIIGVRPVVTHDFFQCISGGVERTWEMAKTLGAALKQIVTGEVGMNELGGPVAIVKVAGDAGKEGVVNFMYLAAFISLNLAIFNMLPFPALDGGRLVFVIIRKITGKAVTQEMEARVHTVGILLLFGLMIYVTWNDITRLFG